MNLDSILESIEYLDAVGVHSIRLLRTTESPRWQQNAKDNALSIEEYYEESLKILKAYAKKLHHAKTIIWQVIRYDPETKEMKFDAVGYDEKHYRDSLPLCSKTRSELCIATNGNIYPCLQGSGLLDTYNLKIGNIFKESLHDLLQSDSNYFKLIDMRIKKRFKHNAECNTCKYWINCIGGCPLLAFYETNGDVLDKDK